MNRRAPYWYKRFITDCCPLCGRPEDRRERQLSPRPQDPAEHVEHHYTACGDCLDELLRERYGSGESMSRPSGQTVTVASPQPNEGE